VGATRVRTKQELAQATLADSTRTAWSFPCKRLFTHGRPKTHQHLALLPPYDAGEHGVGVSWEIKYRIPLPALNDILPSGAATRLMNMRSARR